MSKQVMQMALDHLVNLQPIFGNGLLDETQLRFIEPHIDKAIAALEAELAKPEQEPIAWIGNADFVKGQFVEGRVRRVWWECNTGVGQPLYTEPTRKESENPDGAFIDEGSKPNQEPFKPDWVSYRQGVEDATFTNEGSKPWIGLTDAEMHQIVADRTPDDATLEELNDFVLTVRNTESKLKEKNGG